MAQVKPIHKIRAAAYYFVFVSRNLKRIATDFKVNSRTIKRWAKEPEWTEVLDACDYKGDRDFEVQATRDAQGAMFAMNSNKARDSLSERGLRRESPSINSLRLVGEKNRYPAKTGRLLGANDTAGWNSGK